MKMLLVTRDPEMISIFAHVFHEKSVEMYHCPWESLALYQLSSDKFAAIVLDFDNVAGYATILKNLPRPNTGVVVIAVASTSIARQAASDVNASFVIERPLSPEQVRRVLCETHELMLREVQAYFRLTIELPIWIRRGCGTVLQCNTRNVSQSGAAIVSSFIFEVGEEVNICFSIPNTNIVVSGPGKVIWDDKQGTTGISFECAASPVKASLIEWLHGHFLEISGERSSK